MITQDVAKAEEEERTCARRLQTVASDIKKANGEFQRIDTELKKYGLLGQQLATSIVLLPTPLNKTSRNE